MVESARHDNTVLRWSAARFRNPLICALVLGREGQDLRRGTGFECRQQEVVAGLGGGQGLRCPCSQQQGRGAGLRSTVGSGQEGMDPEEGVRDCVGSMDENGAR